MQTDAKKSRVYIIDILKVICCFFVFRIHMGGVTHIAEQIVFTAVPIFIFLTSYNYTQSAYSRNELTLQKAYRPARIIGKIARLYIPYAVFSICQVILIATLDAGYPTGNIVLSAFFGGYGPGNYYLVLMLQVILIFPLMLALTRKHPNITLISCLIIYFVYHIILCFAFPDNLHDVTSPGGIINKWTVFKYIFLIECGIYFYHKCDKFKWWIFLLIMCADIIPFILANTTNLPTMYTRGIPLHFITFGMIGLLLKYFKKLSLGKFNSIIAYCGNATWHIFLFQQLYFWLIDLIKWNFGFTYISFPICFTGGMLFYTAQLLITKLIRYLKTAPPPRKNKAEL